MKSEIKSESKQMIKNCYPTTLADKFVQTRGTDEIAAESDTFDHVRSKLISSWHVM